MYMKLGVIYLLERVGNGINLVYYINTNFYFLSMDETFRLHMFLVMGC